MVSNSTSNSFFGNAYTTLFGEERGNVDEVNQEIIFQLVYDDNPGDGIPANGAVNSFYGNSNTIGLVAPSDYIFSDIKKTSDRKIFADRNKKNDSRMYYNCNLDDQGIYKYTTTTIEIDASKTEEQFSGYGSTPVITYDSRYTQDKNGSNWIIYRLADIMLLKAEALTQMAREGDGQETNEYNKSVLDRAFTLVNAVNKRAICKSQLVDTLRRNDYVNKGDMETLVLQERQRELMFEGKRWFDLVRLSQRTGNTSTLKAAALAKATIGQGMIGNHLTKMDAIYWPYNLDEMKVNLNLVQNPAFGSGENDSYEKTTKN